MKKILLGIGLIMASNLAQARFLIDLPNAAVSTLTLGMIPYGEEPGLRNWGGAIVGTATAGIYKPCGCGCTNCTCGRSEGRCGCCNQCECN